MDRSIIMRVSAIIYREFGIRVHEAKSFVLEAKLERLVAREGYADLGDFYTQLERGESGAKEKLARYITTGHTYFFRESDHFDYLAEEIKRRRLPDPLIWCAASSTGEEAYSITITLLQAGIEHFRIVASDMNPDVLSAFNAGIYVESCFRSMPAPYRKFYFTKAGEGRFKPVPELRSHLSIKRINIMDEFSFPRKFDFIFCRNMLIYFDAESRNAALQRLMGNLADGGLLFLGHTEAVLDPPQGLARDQTAVLRKSG